MINPMKCKVFVGRITPSMIPQAAMIDGKLVRYTYPGDAREQKTQKQADERWRDINAARDGNLTEDDLRFLDNWVAEHKDDMTLEVQVNEWMEDMCGKIRIVDIKYDQSDEYQTIIVLYRMDRGCMKEHEKNMKLEGARIW